MQFGGHDMAAGLEVRAEHIAELKVRFDREGISIPFPQRDLHVYQADLSGVNDDKAAA